MYERTLTISSITGLSDLTPHYTYNGVKFVRGFLKRTTTTSTDASDMRISDATDDPLELLTYMNEIASETQQGDANYSDNAQKMYFVAALMPTTVTYLITTRGLIQTSSPQHNLKNLLTQDVCLSRLPAGKEEVKVQMTGLAVETLVFSGPRLAKLIKNPKLRRYIFSRSRPSLPCHANLRRLRINAAT